MKRSKRAGWLWMKADEFLKGGDEVVQDKVGG